jgi:hypothetical protein
MNGVHGYGIDFLNIGKVYEAEDDRGKKVAIKRVEKVTDVISREVDILKLVSFVPISNFLSLSQFFIFLMPAVISLSVHISYYKF